MHDYLNNKKFLLLNVTSELLLYKKTPAPTTWLSCNDLTPYSKSVLQKPTVACLVTEFTALYETRRYISVFTTDRHIIQLRAK